MQRATDMEEEEGQVPKEEERKPWDTRDWTCECYPDFEHAMSSGIPPIPVPPIFDPCCCYGLPEPFAKPGPNAFYLGMGYKAPNMRGPEYLQTPGFFPRQPGQKEYTVERSGVSALPPFNEGDLEQQAILAESYIISGANGFQVEVSEYGARVVAIRAPDVDGNCAEVLLGFDSAEDYWRNSALHWGGVAGRLADRIRGPRPNLIVPGVGWCLFPENDEEDHFMGGEEGLDRVIWDAHLQDHGVLFTYLSRAGDEDYPGNVVVSVSYSVVPVNKLVIHMDAVSTAPTPLALMLPLIFNLAGHNSGEVALKDHVLTVHSDKYYKKNAVKRVSGVQKHVATTPYDLRIPRNLRKILRHAPNKNYDMLMCMGDPLPGEEQKQRLMARLFHPTCRRVMEVWSDLPVLHMATNLGLTKRPRAPPDADLLDEARKMIEEILALIVPCDDILPTFVKKKEFPTNDKTQEKLSSPNPGDIRTLPVVDKEESLMVVSGILDDILGQVKERPPEYRGYNNYKYFDDCGIMLYPRLPPLLPHKINLGELVLRPGQRYSHTITYVFGVSPRPQVRKRRRFGRQRPFKRLSDLMIDHCSAASSLSLDRRSFAEIRDVCSSEFSSEPSI